MDHPLATGHRLPLLDGVRGVAILLVLAAHVISETLEPAAAGLDAAVQTTANAGWTGVDLFFVLSGFLITGILLDTKGQPWWWGRFLLRRALRIVPLYYGALVVLFVVLPWITHWPNADFDTLQKNQGWYWGYAVNVLWARTHGAGVPLNTRHLWSLSVEEQFYLLWPLAVWACAPRTLLRVAAVAALFGLIFRLGVVLGDPAFPTAAYLLTPGRLDGLMVGAATAVAVRAPGGLAHLKAWAPPLLGAGVCAIGALVAWRHTLNPEDPVVAVVAYPMVALCFGALLAAALTAHPSSRLVWVLSNQSLGRWGQYSYGIYVIHFPLLGAIEWKTTFYQQRVAWLGGSQLPSVLILTAVVMSLSYGLGWLSYHGFEKRFLALKRYSDRPADRPCPQGESNPCSHLERVVS